MRFLIIALALAFASPAFAADQPSQVVQNLAIISTLADQAAVAKHEVEQLKAQIEQLKEQLAAKPAESK